MESSFLTDLAPGDRELNVVRSLDSSESAAGFSPSCSRRTHRRYGFRILAPICGFEETVNNMYWWDRLTRSIDRQRFLFSLALVTGSLGIYLSAAFYWHIRTGASVDLVSLLLQWDSRWYLSIVESGYQEVTATDGQANWAFFPLYPLTVFVFKSLTGLSSKIAGVVLSNIYLTIGVYYVHHYLSCTRNRSVASTAAILLTFGLYSFYFSTVYTESLFLMLLAIGFYQLHHHRWLVAGICGALLSATRGVGVLFGLPLLISMVSASPYTLRQPSELLRDFVESPRRLIALLLVPVGTILFMLYLHLHVGNALAFLEVQSEWGREFGNPLGYLIAGLLGDGALGGLQSRYVAVWAIVGLLLSLHLVSRKQFAEGTFAFLSILIPVSSGLISAPRYVIGTIVVVFAMADLIHRIDDEKWRVAIIAGLSAINTLLLLLWFSSSPLVA